MCSSRSEGFRGQDHALIMGLGVGCDRNGTIYWGMNYQVMYLCLQRHKYITWVLECSPLSDFIMGPQKATYGPLWPLPQRTATGPALVRQSVGGSVIIHAAEYTQRPLNCPSFPVRRLLMRRWRNQRLDGAHVWTHKRSQLYIIHCCPVSNNSHVLSKLIHYVSNEPTMWFTTMHKHSTWKNILKSVIIHHGYSTNGSAMVVRACHLIYSFSTSSLS